MAVWETGISAGAAARRGTRPARGWGALVAPDSRQVYRKDRDGPAAGCTHAARLAGADAIDAPVAGCLVRPASARGDHRPGEAGYSLGGEPEVLEQHPGRRGFTEAIQPEHGATSVVGRAADHSDPTPAVTRRVSPRMAVAAMK